MDNQNETQKTEQPKTNFTKKCPKCGTDYDIKAVKCPSCHKRYPNKNNKIIAIILAILVIGGIGAFLEEDKSSQNETQTTSTQTSSSPVAKKQETKKQDVKKPSATKKTSPSDVKKAFISSCSKYDYKKLARYPDKYKGKKITVKVKVSQIMDGGLFDDTTYYRCYTKGKYDTWFENEYIIIDERGENATKILQDDILTVYGTYTGTKEIERAITSTNDNVPAISMKYCKIKE